ncbi:MAG: metal-dependent transcriptional regulator [Actinobacteria bacterium]|nr:metal-dependent transcriptional regulator [Actinomycetota bacterium]
MDVLTPGLENYLEAILRVGLEKEVVRVKDIEKLLNVKAPSIVESVKSLAERDLVEYERYGYIKLTEKGTRIAREIYRRHKMLAGFFNRIIGVDLETATQDACAIEHYLSKKTLDHLLKFVEFVESHPEREPMWLSSFHYYVKYGELPDYCRKRREEVKKGKINNGKEKNC